MVMQRSFKITSVMHSELFLLLQEMNKHQLLVLLLDKNCREGDLPQGQSVTPLTGKMRGRKGAGGEGDIF